MKTALSLSAIILLVPLAAAAPLPTIHLPDGITALVASVGATVDEVVARDADGNFAFDVRVFESDADGAWSQVARYATLRIAVYDAEGEHDVFSQGAPMSATEAVRIVAPGDVATTGQPMDVWVTIYKVTSYPTSHYSVEKNAAIGLGWFDTADHFDYHHGLNPIAG